MKKYIFFLLVCFIGQSLSAQMVNANITIDAQQTGRTQLSVFKTLEGALAEFLNSSDWGSENLPQNQRVDASFFITVKSYSSNNFRATIQVQSSRPVYGSAMVTPVFNFKDDQFNFTYEEHQPLNFNPNSFENNLVSTLSFYMYVILGLDADTFLPEGGGDYFAQADQIANLAQQGGSSGWSSGSGQNSRYELNSQLNSSNYRDFHEALYQYHRLGLDMMHEDLEEGKNNIVEAINMLNEVNRSRPNTLLIRSFFDAKAGEVSSIFNGGPEVENLEEVVQSLNNMAPTYSAEWRSLK